MDRGTELRRLARLLHRDTQDLAYLQKLDAKGLGRLRTLIQGRFLDEFAPVFRKLAAGGAIAPDALSALLCKRVFGPALTANMSYYVPTSRAVGMSKHFDVNFMSEIAREQIPERAEEQLRELPLKLMREVTRKLLESGDFHVMGGFTDYLPEDRALALMEEIEDPADHLRISRFTQHKDRIARLAVAQDDEALMEFIRAAFTHPDFVAEVGLITAEMSDEEQRRMARLSDAVDPSYREKSAQIASAAGLASRLSAFLQP